ncbi:hypothetical protein L1987_07718 [Smallanthus sonchifolius]|uniref:Uncharacterized protein n=1 Tax=Smallanthus sonchifolius TaxID=185202 RepID=A0ACB9K195_9ASTR|nr:hypothetical protein L1987_07718 [Smallanthus sonchifolius]
MKSAFRRLITSLSRLLIFIFLFENCSRFIGFRSESIMSSIRLASSCESSFVAGLMEDELEQELRRQDAEFDRFMKIQTRMTVMAVMDLPGTGSSSDAGPGHVSTFEKDRAWHAPEELDLPAMQV